MPKAFFVKEPERVDQLRRPFPAEQAREYRVVSQVLLSALDYANFAGDLLADRDFLEQALPLCAEGPVFDCVLVRCAGGKDGILAVPEQGGFLRYAAWVSDSGKTEF